MREDVQLRWAVTALTAVSTSILAAVVASAVAWSSPPPLLSRAEADAVVADAFSEETVTYVDREEAFLGRVAGDELGAADPADAFRPGAVWYDYDSGWSDDDHSRVVDAAVGALEAQGWEIRRFPLPGSLQSFSGVRDDDALLFETAGDTVSAIALLRATPRGAVTAEVLAGLAGLVLGGIIGWPVLVRSPDRALRRPLPLLVTGIVSTIALLPAFAFALLGRLLRGSAATGPLWADYAAITFLWLCAPAAAIAVVGLWALIVGEVRAAGRS